VAVLAGASPAGAFVSGDGLRVVSEQHLDARLVALQLHSAALGADTDVRVLLPTGYAPGAHRRYPVLYLLDGTSGTAADWTTSGGAEATTAGLPLIVVMPNIDRGGDGGGWCTNSVDRDPGAWETYHVAELIPWIDANLPTIAGRGGRAIAGLSQGGFCAMSYAARFPDRFGTALSYSGAPDIAYDAEARTIITPVIEYTASVLDGAAPDAMFGPRDSNEINWAAHDPATLAANLGDTRLSLFTGNGQPGPLDGGASLLTLLTAGPIEAGAERLTELFQQRLQTLGIPGSFDDYGPGTHTWPYWARDLSQSIDAIMSDFAHPLPDPRQVTYTSGDGAYAVYGWEVAMHRRVRELSTLAAADRSGFELRGSGSATVATPAFYAPRSVHLVRVGRGRRHRLRATASGRLLFTVPLGPSNTVPEFSAGGSSTKVFSTVVRVG
jgi:S-formylglutathione hydrolase FrmB